MARVRCLYLSAPGSETACRELLAVTSGIDEKANPVQAGYHAAATMIMAKYFVNPVRKLVWFHDGEALLERAVAASEGSAELRFVRYGIQSGSPGFLGYRHHLETDRAILQKFADKGGTDELSVLIRDLLRATEVGHAKALTHG